MAMTASNFSHRNFSKMNDIAANTDDLLDADTAEIENEGLLIRNSHKSKNDEEQLIQTGKGFTGSSKAFIKTYLFLIIGLFVFPLFINYCLLYRTGELLPFSKIVQKQLKEKAIFESPLNQNFYGYKLALIRQLKPDIMAVGSSRVMQFQHYFFNHSFGNAGGGISHTNEGYQFIKELLQIHHPKLLILGVDFWWFNSDHKQPQSFPADYRDNSPFPTVETLIKPLNYFWEGKLSLQDYGQMLVEPTRKNRFTSFNTIGISAIKTSSGFFPDGSYMYTAGLSGTKKMQDDHFAYTFSRIDTASDRFEAGTQLGADRVKEFLATLQLCKQANVPVILILPPLAPAVVKKMATRPNQYIYIDRLRDFLQQLPVEEYYDFTDVQPLHSSNCEFVDGYHGGTVTYARMLLNIIQKNKNSKLVPYTNQDLLQQNVEEFKGKAFIRFQPSQYHYREVDFLHLGCHK
jgi:hypothetical protein